MDIRRDIEANRGQIKGMMVVVMFRVAHWARSPYDRPPRWWAVPVGITYRLIVEWLLTIEIPWRTSIGSGFRVLHGAAIVINDKCIIGNNVSIRQSVTIGNNCRNGACPRIEDDVELGAGSIVLGAITVGTGARVGAGAVVTKSVPAGTVVVGNPARIIRRSDGV